MKKTGIEHGTLTLVLEKQHFEITTLRKDLIRKRLDRKFIGHTEYLQKMDKKRYSNMILINKKLSILDVQKMGAEFYLFLKLRVRKSVRI